MTEDKIMRIIKKTIALMLAVLLLSGIFSCAQAATYSAKVFSSAMKVYDASGKGVGALGQGKSFTVKAISGSWALVEYKGKTGYAKMDDIIFNARIPGIVTKDSTFNYVTKASYRDKSYYSASIQAGTKVYVAGIHGSYLLVANGDGSILGYIKSSNVQKA